MLNHSVLVGRICNDMKISKDKILDIVLAVPRNYKGTDGEYATDYIDAKLYGSVATNTIEYCKCSDLVAIKGSIEKEDNSTYIRVEKISFLAPDKAGKDEK